MDQLTLWPDTKPISARTAEEFKRLYLNNPEPQPTILVIAHTHLAAATWARRARLSNVKTVTQALSLHGQHRDTPIIYVDTGRRPDDHRAISKELKRFTNVKYVT